MSDPLQAKIAEALKMYDFTYVKDCRQHLAVIADNVAVEHYRPLLDAADDMAEWLAEWATPDGAEPAWLYQAMRGREEG